MSSLEVDVVLRRPEACHPGGGGGAGPCWSPTAPATTARCSALMGAKVEQPAERGPEPPPEAAPEQGQHASLTAIFFSATPEQLSALRPAAGWTRPSICRSTNFGATARYSCRWWTSGPSVQPSAAREEERLDLVERLSAGRQGSPPKEALRLLPSRQPVRCRCGGALEHTGRPEAAHRLLTAAAAAGLSARLDGGRPLPAGCLLAWRCFAERGTDLAGSSGRTGWRMRLAAGPPGRNLEDRACMRSWLTGRRYLDDIQNEKGVQVTMATGTEAALPNIWRTPSAATIPVPTSSRSGRPSSTPPGAPRRHSCGRTALPSSPTRWRWPRSWRRSCTWTPSPSRPLCSTTRIEDTAATYEDIAKRFCSHGGRSGGGRQQADPGAVQPPRKRSRWRTSGRCSWP